MSKNDLQSLEQDIKNTQNTDGALSTGQVVATGAKATATAALPLAVAAQFIHKMRSRAAKMEYARYQKQNPVFADAMEDNTIDVQARVVPDKVPVQRQLDTNVEFVRGQQAHEAKPNFKEAFESEPIRTKGYKFAEEDAKFFSWKSAKTAFKPSVLAENAQWAFKKHPITSTVTVGIALFDAASTALEAYQDYKADNQSATSESLGKIQAAYAVATPENQQALAAAVLGREPLGKHTSKISSSATADTKIER